MALIDIYRNNVSRKKKELSKLQSDKASEIKNASESEKKILSAKNSISRTQSESLIRSKYREIGRISTKLATINKKISTLETKIVDKSKEIVNEEKKVKREEERERKKREQAEAKNLKETQKYMKELQSSIAKHDSLHQHTQKEIEDLKRIPEKINVLFMASNPIDQEPLRLDEEAREIEEMIRKSQYRDSVSFITKWAARPLDILQAINEINPTIIHFSGHGLEGDELVFQDNSGRTKLIKKEAIVQTMVSTSDDIKLVFFNTCFSFGQAKAVTEHVDAAIGMNTSIGDDAARIFAAHFYSAVGFGHSVHKAFQQAKSALMLEGISEENTPDLYTQHGIEASKLILVKPFAQKDS
ncbi:CHAT domain-containing protein [Priestia megaterium]|uniref:CHAT domain-containing protein n=1 Tax=Priestia megaterium TaxID=1404 RepID=UPI002D7E65C5|nr:CHAT domain-containing protein [Priestia megaterium]MEB4861015.1 CHAT domain-containing protein [Priestia megaterium]